jgi:exopolysaccharide biosynthesis polyprenyl glycosylphosphotransferase
LAQSHRRLAPRPSDDVAPLIAAAALPLVITPALATADEVQFLVATLPLVVGGLIAGRTLSYSAVRCLRSAPERHRRALIVGSDQTAADLLAAAETDPRLGLDIVGYVGERSGLQAERYGAITDLPQLAQVYGVEHVIVAAADDDDAEAVRALRTCETLGLQISVVPRMFRLGAAPPGTSVDWLWKTPIVHVPPHPQQTLAWAVKRGIDVAMSLMLLLLLAPLIGLVAVMIRMSSEGPVLFRQERVTEAGKCFQLLKFRTFAAADASHTRWDDSGLQLTKLGSFLRKTSIDELHQLINILRGEMSFVGPRPERTYFVERFTRSIEAYGERHRVPGGLTGWAQVHGLRGDTSLEDRAEFDNAYIERWSLWLDLVILVRTVKAFAQRDGR